MNKVLSAVPPTENRELQEAVRERLDRLTKPLGSLGRLEELALQFCLCRGRKDAEISRMKVFTFAGDHGITEENLTPYPSEVTYQMVMNMVGGGAAISVMCRNAGIACAVVDMGVKGVFPDRAGLVKRKIAEGTRNFRKEPAMTEEECLKALEAGYVLAKPWAPSYPGPRHAPWGRDRIRAGHAGPGPGHGVLSPDGHIRVCRSCRERGLTGYIKRMECLLTSFRGPPE